MQRKPLVVRLGNAIDVTSIIAELTRAGFTYEDRTRIKDVPFIKETTQVALLGEETQVGGRTAAVDLTVVPTPSKPDEVQPDKLIETLKTKGLEGSKTDEAKKDDPAEAPIPRTATTPPKEEAAARIIKGAVGAEGHESPTEVAHDMKKRHQALLGLGG